MKTIRVNLKSDSYNIVVGNKTLSKLGSYLKKINIGKDAIIITSANIKRMHGSALANGLKRSGFSVKYFLVPDGEKSKSAKVAMKLIEDIARYDVYKKSFIVAFGGGVVGDLAGYVAAAYKRGIPYIQVPTTFLAQIDSAIGGKVAIDLPVGKNLVGAFYQPKVVWTDISVLSTLSDRQIRNGFAEAIKYGIIYDQKLFSFIEKNYEGVFIHKRKVVERIVLDCSRIKRNVVVLDEKETKNIRTILNFGHTVGHAIEAAGKYSRYHHGEAIAIGMRIAADISCQYKLLSKKADEQINALLSSVGLPQEARGVKLADILRIMRHDKKFVSGKNKFVLATRIGKVKVIEGVSLDIIKRATKKYMR